MGKINILKKLVEEYVGYLNLWEKVSVEEIEKDVVYITETLTYTDRYGIENTVIRYIEKPAEAQPYIKVTYHQPKGKWKDILHPNGFESREFPLYELDRRIAHYRNKLYHLKKKEDEKQ